MTYGNGTQLEVVGSSLESMPVGLPTVFLPLCLPSRSLHRVLVGVWSPRVDLLRSLCQSEGKDETGDSDVGVLDLTCGSFPGASKGLGSLR